MPTYRAFHKPWRRPAYEVVPIDRDAISAETIGERALAHLERGDSSVPATIASQIIVLDDSEVWVFPLSRSADHSKLELGTELDPITLAPANVLAEPAHEPEPEPAPEPATDHGPAAALVAIQTSDQPNAIWRAYPQENRSEGTLIRLHAEETGVKLGEGTARAAVARFCHSKGDLLAATGNALTFYDLAASGIKIEPFGSLP